MCYWYTHIYNCKHVTYALGKYCSQAGLVQTPCKKKHIWQTIRMGEDCEDCAMPEGRGNNVVDNADPVGGGGGGVVQHKVGVKTKKRGRR
ncbi:hypothetical protein ACEPPN_012761 [Leptodophora sp. 'Broadleaf-Isolate-01']